MIPVYHCKNCRYIFMLPQELTNGLDITLYVCPNCKSRNWGKIAI
jgi:hypothetical protein